MESIRARVEQLFYTKVNRRPLPKEQQYVAGAVPSAPGTYHNGAYRLPACFIPAAVSPGVHVSQAVALTRLSPVKGAGRDSPKEQIAPKRDRSNLTCGPRLYIRYAAGLSSEAVHERKPDLIDLPSCFASPCATCKPAVSINKIDLLMMPHSIC